MIQRKSIRQKVKLEINEAFEEGVEVDEKEDEGGCEREVGKKTTDNGFIALISVQNLFRREQFPSPL